MGEEEEGMDNGEAISCTLVGPAVDTTTRMSLSSAINCGTEHEILF